jgi:hypothetical protein
MADSDSESASRRETIRKLEGEANYKPWHTQIRLHLGRRGLWKVANGEEPEPDQEEPTKVAQWSTRAEKASYVILLSLAEGPLEHVDHLPVAEPKAILSTLEQLYGTRGDAARFYRLKDLVTTTLEGCNSVTSYIDTLKLHYKRLGDLEGTLPEWVLIGLILFGLGDSYDSYVVNTVSAMRSAAPKLNDVIAGVIDEERRQRGKESATALATRARGKGNGNANKGDNKTKRCTHCKRIGHENPECWQLHPEKRPEKSSDSTSKKKNEKPQPKEDTKGSKSKKREEQQPMGLMAHMHSIDEPTWIFDSGASHYMCNDRGLFTKFAPKQQTARVANSASMAIQGTGTVALTWEAPNGTVREVALFEVLYIPELYTNLLAYEALAKKGVQATLAPTGATIWKDGIEVGHCVRRNGLMFLKTPNLTDGAIATALATQAASPEVWHRRMAHIGHSSIEQLSQVADGVRIVDPSPDGASPGASSGGNSSPSPRGICEPCELGKGTKKISRRPPARATEKLELVHTDVGGPIKPTSLQGHRYYITFTDDLTRAVWIRFMKHKSEALQKLKEFKAHAETQSGCSIKRLRSDNGGEYASSAAQDFYKQHGIQWEPTAPYSPQQNGVSERLNRTIMERVRCMLYDTNLSKKLWQEAARTVVYLKNRSPASSIAKDTTPYELWHGKRPNLEHIRTFGSKCLAYVPNTSAQKKLDTRAINGYLIGYDASNIYRVWQPKNRRVLRLRDVTIDETIVGIEPILINSGGTKPAELILPSTESSQPDTSSDSGSVVQLESDSESELELPLEQQLERQLEQQLEQQPEEQPAPRTSARSNKGVSGTRYQQEQAEHTRMEQQRRENRRQRQQEATQHEDSDIPDYGIQLGDPAASLAFAYLAAVSSNFEAEPQTYEEALESEHSEHWKHAMDAEVESLQKNSTWVLEDLLAERKALRGKWVYRYKFGAKGQVLKHKARWVVKGFMQKHGIDYDETYAAVVKPMSYKALFALAAIHDLEIEQMDFIAAFLHSKLQETVYMQQPTGYHDGTRRACRLLRALYGLKQSPRAWYETLIEFLHGLGYTRTAADYSVLYNSNGTTIAIYVDDLLIFGKQLSIIQDLKAELNASFNMTDLGPCAFYLGIEVTRDRKARTITLSQAGYIEKLLRAFGMANCRPVATPLEPGARFTKNEGQATEEDTLWYQRVMGSFMYAMTETRPDIAIVISTLSEFLTNPSTEHLVAAKRVFRYFQGTKAYGTTHGARNKLCDQLEHEPGQLHGYVDADFAQNLETRRSTTGYVFMLGEGPISWTSKRQPTVALSSCEAEYMAETQAAKEAIWLRRLLTELGYTSPDVQTVRIYADNQGAIALAKNPEYHARTKHIDTQWHFVREQAELGTIRLDYVPTDRQLADGFTKPLGGTKFKEFVRGLGLRKVNHYTSSKAR